VNRRAVVLLLGGLDSMLSVLIMQMQGLEVEGVNIRTQFLCCGKSAAEMAAYLNMPLTVFATDEKYLDVISNPEFGYGRGANPCVDCRLFMLDLARYRMDQIDTDIVVSGDILGQRPHSQGRRDL
jgi:tRNA-specific 2-thiouridylase